MKQQLFQPWVIRKIIYGLTSIVLAGAVAAGVVDTGTAEQWLSQVGAIAAALGSAALALASAKTGEHSDTTTAVARDGVVAAPIISGEELAGIVAEQISGKWREELLNYVLPGVRDEENSNP